MNSTVDEAAAHRRSNMAKCVCTSIYASIDVLLLISWPNRKRNPQKRKWIDSLLLAIVQPKGLCSTDFTVTGRLLPFETFLIRKGFHFFACVFFESLRAASISYLLCSHFFSSSSAFGFQLCRPDRLVRIVRQERMPKRMNVESVSDKEKSLFGVRFLFFFLSVYTLNSHLALSKWWNKSGWVFPGKIQITVTFI